MNERIHLSSTTPQPAASQPERSHGKQITGPAVAGERPPSLHEPWSINPVDGSVMNAEQEVIADRIGMEVGSDDLVRSLVEIEALEAAYLRRIVACVNACEGISTEDLEKCIGVIARVVPA